MSEKEQIEYYESYILRSQEEKNNFLDFITNIRSSYESNYTESQKMIQIGLHIENLRKKNREFALKYLV